MESVQSRDDDNSSVVIVTPAEPVEAQIKGKTAEETKPEATEGKDNEPAQPDTTAPGANASKAKSEDVEMKDGEEKKEDEEKKDDEKKEDEEEKDDEEEKKEKIIVGLVTDSKDLYAKYDNNGDRSWTDKYPDDLEEAAENEETQKYAVIIRKSKFHPRA